MAQSSEVPKVTVTRLRRPSRQTRKELFREVLQTEKSAVTANGRKSAEAITKRKFGKG